jgi:hypothetical protein
VTVKQDGYNTEAAHMGPSPPLRGPLRARGGMAGVSLASRTPGDGHEAEVHARSRDASAGQETPLRGVHPQVQ